MYWYVIILYLLSVLYNGMMMDWYILKQSAQVYEREYNVFDWWFILFPLESGNAGWKM